MNDTDSFIKLVNGVCRHSKMYTLDGSFGEVAAIFTGIQIASPNSPIGGDAEGTFKFFITSRLLVPNKFWWASAIQMATSDDDTAIMKLNELLVEFATLRLTKSLEEIRELAARSVSDYTETEPAKIWKQFIAARYTTSQDEIEPLIMPHPDAALLWRSDPTPPGVTAQLTSISDSYTISIISGSVESGEVSLATEIGIIKAHLVDSGWRIDASKLIEIAKKVGNAGDIPESGDGH